MEEKIVTVINEMAEYLMYLSTEKGSTHLIENGSTVLTVQIDPKFVYIQFNGLSLCTVASRRSPYQRLKPAGAYCA